MLSVIFSVISAIMLVVLLADFREMYTGDTVASCDTGASGDPNMYDYARENPNALLKGKNISGTVYSDYPTTVPGLGWIL